MLYKICKTLLECILNESAFRIRPIHMNTPLYLVEQNKKRTHFCVLIAFIRNKMNQQMTMYDNSKFNLHSWRALMHVHFSLLCTRATLVLHEKKINTKLWRIWKFRPMSYLQPKSVVNARFFFIAFLLFQFIHSLQCIAFGRDVRIIERFNYLCVIWVHRIREFARSFDLCVFVNHCTQSIWKLFCGIRLIEIDALWLYSLGYFFLESESV